MVDIPGDETRNGMGEKFLEGFYSISDILLFYKRLKANMCGGTIAVYLLF